MSDVVTWLILLSALILSLGVLPLVVLWFLSIVGSDAPFVPVPREAIPGIVDALELSHDAVVYDMGCGDGRILFACKEKQPGIQAVGIEKALLPYLIARMKEKSRDVHVIHGDFFSHSLSDATHVVLYLFPELMEEVEKKLARELKPGTRVLAVDFQFKDRERTAFIEQKIQGIHRGTDLSLYIF